MNAIQLLQLPLFQGISEAAARQLLAEAPNSVRRYKEGDFIARQGDPAVRSIYYVQETYVHKWKMRKGNKSPSTG